MVDPSDTHGSRVPLDAAPTVSGYRINDTADHREMAQVKRQVFLDSMREWGDTSFARTELGQRVARLQVALEQHLESMHEQVIRPVEDLGWSGAALYLQTASGTSLEAVAATDATVPGVVRHGLPLEAAHDDQPIACDIEVHTFLGQRAERLGRGYDPRYNRYVYETLGHERFVERLFVPLLLVRDLVDFSLQQAECRWTRDGNFWIPDAPSMQLQAIGTLSVSSFELVSEETIARTLEFATRVAAPLAHKISLQGLCETLISEIARVSGCHSATLHLLSRAPVADIESSSCVLLREGNGISRVSPSSGALGARPRATGIGAEALRLSLPVRYEDEALRERSPALAAEGIQAADAYPLVGAEGRCVGLVYVHYRDRRPRASLAQVFDVVSAAAHVLDVALRFKQRSYLREHMLSEALRLSSGPWASTKARVWAMAGFAWNLLGCDHVSVLASSADEADAPQLVVGHAGRCRTNAPPSADDLQAILHHVADDLGPRFLETGTTSDIFARGSFALGEGFEATAVLPLARSDNGVDPVGLLVVDYRHPHSFDSSEEDLLRELSLLFAQGICMKEGEFATHDILQRSAKRLQLRKFGESNEVCRVIYSSSSDDRLHPIPPGASCSSDGNDEQVEHSR